MSEIKTRRGAKQLKVYKTIMGTIPESSSHPL